MLAPWLLLLCASEGMQKMQTTPSAPLRLRGGGVVGNQYGRGRKVSDAEQILKQRGKGITNLAVKHGLISRDDTMDQSSMSTLDKRYTFSS